MRTRAMPMLLALISAGIVVFAQQNEYSLFAPPTQKNCVFSKSVDVATGVLHGREGNSTFIVSFITPSFDGLERITTPNGFEYRKNDRTITAYPDSLTVAVESNASRFASLCALHSQPIADCKDEDTKLVRITARWLDSSGYTSDSKSGALRRIVEPWPENRPARHWYIADLSGITAPIGADVQITIIGTHDEVLGTFKGGIAPAMPAKTSTK